jgi:hypothetical protein
MQPATPELLRTNGVTTTPSRLGASVGKDTKRERARPVAPVNYVALNKDDNAGLNSAGDIAFIFFGQSDCAKLKMFMPLRLRP